MSQVHVELLAPGQYGSPDSFGSVPGAPIVTDPATGIRWTLGFGPAGPDGVTPSVIYVAVSTWAIAKSRLGPTWADAKRAATTWGIAKAITAT